MTSDENPKPRSALLSFSFLGASLIGSLTMALVSVFAPPAAQIAILGALVSILGGLFLAYLEQDGQRERRRAQLLEKLAVPLVLAHDASLYARYAAICQGLTNLVRQTDPVLRQIALLKLFSVSGQIADLATGTVVFASTEGWRTVYEELLRSPDIRAYRSVAWVRSKDYWQDQPGRQSLQVNYEAVRRGVLTDRVIVLRDDLWPKDLLLPSTEILPWIEDQHNHGLRIHLVRESELANEPDLLADFGIYGTRALGTQELDERSRTLRFTLDFNPDAIRLAEERWQRLLLYTTTLRKLLDQMEEGR